MFTALNTLLDIDNTITPKEKFFLVSESHNDGSFLIHHFLTFYLKGGHNVCFVGLVQSFTHYSSVAQKLFLVKTLQRTYHLVFREGVNLSTSLQNGKLTFVEGLKYAVQSMTKCETNEMQNNPFVGLSSREPRLSLKPLYEKIKEAIAKFENNQPFLLLLDDVSVLLSLGLSTTDIQDFIHYCVDIACASEKAGCLVTLVHADHDDILGDSEEEILERQLIYKCNMQLHIKGLKSGHCREVHGQLEIINHDAGIRTGRPSEKIVQYKISDKHVTFFAPGNSASVL